MNFAASKGVSNCFFRTGYAEEMPYDDNSFDVLLMEDVMEHVADPKKVVAECCRVVRPGGTLIIKFPSFKGMASHHFDRAITLPGLHYLLPMRVWASGLNDLLVREGANFHFEPFDEIVDTAYRKGVTHNLNGMDFSQFSEIVRQAPLEPSVLKMTPFNVNLGKPKLTKKLYGAVYNLGLMQEFLSSNIILVAKRKA